ncbi:MAG: CoA transferase, partial [Solirubrobacterales bacterium]
ALGSELVREREMVVEWEQPELGPVRQLGVPVKLSRTPGGVHAPAPALGEHTREVLSAAGFDESEIDALLASGDAAGPAEEATDRSFMG